MSDPAGSVVVILRSGIGIRPGDAAGRFEIVAFNGAAGTFHLDQVAPFLERPLTQLADGLSVAALEDSLIDLHGPAGLAAWYAVLSALENAALIDYVASHNGHPLLRFTPAAPGRVTLRAPSRGAMRLSRFAHLRRNGDTLCIDSPLARGRVEVTELRIAAVVAALHVALTRAQVVERVGAEVDAWIGSVLSLLVAAGIVQEADEEGLTEEDRSIDAQHWEFADLLLHSRSRTNRVDLPVGGTYRFPGVPPLAPMKAPMSEARIPLETPDLAALRTTDESLSSVLERRRSVRRQGDPPIDLPQLGKFLFRTAGARPDASADAQDPTSGLGSRRVYPGGGACHPLEIYLVVARCTGLPGGLYRYDAAAHCLELLPDPTDGVGELLQQVSVPIEGGHPSQILLVITARFRRMSWKYEGNAYALIMQEVGVLYEAMYLVATAMGLAPCAVGGGDAARFAEIIGTDPLGEASVGAFTLGTVG